MLRLISSADVRKLTGFSRQRFNEIRSRGIFPSTIPLSKSKQSRTNYYIEQEVDYFMKLFVSGATDEEIKNKISEKRQSFKKELEQ